MIRCALASDDLAATHFAVSPLFECVASYRVLHQHVPHPMLAPWVAEARRALGGQSFPLLTAIICNTTGYLPDFLVPPPSESSPRFDDELAAVLSADDDVMVREIARTSRSGVLRADLAERLEEPARLRSGLADELSRYWACVGAGHWARIVSVLEADIAFRAREMAVCGTGPMLNRLHAMVRYEAGAISVTAGSDSACHSRGRGWVLMPSVFTWPTVRVTTTDPWRPAMSYPARGVAEVWDGVPPVGEDALGTLLGRRRAAVLAALAVPRTTLEVAGRLSITPGAASLHLSRLHEARVVDRMRAGRYVFYVANDCGRVIINAAR